eukprot:401627-Pyramimonas_sp.AAC.1
MGSSNSGNPYQETPCLPPGCPGFLGFRCSCHGKRDVPTPEISGPSQGWVSCGRLLVVELPL